MQRYYYYASRSSSYPSSEWDEHFSDYFFQSRGLQLDLRPSPLQWKNSLSKLRHCLLFCGLRNNDDSKIEGGCDNDNRNEGFHCQGEMTLNNNEISAHNKNIGCNKVDDDEEEDATKPLTEIIIPFNLDLDGDRREDGAGYSDCSTCSMVTSLDSSSKEEEEDIGKERNKEKEVNVTTGGNEGELVFSPRGVCELFDLPSFTSDTFGSINGDELKINKNEERLCIGGKAKEGKPSPSPMKLPKLYSRTVKRMSGNMG